MATIDLSNYSVELYQSSVGRAGTPDGNVFFNLAGQIEFIPATELATIIITDTAHPRYTDGSTPVANNLLDTDGLKFEAIYAFENERRANNEALRLYDRWTAASFKFAGAFSFVNGRVPSTAADRAIIRGSGWKELTGATVDAIYFGNKGLSNIFGASQPYFQRSFQGTAVDFSKVGQIDEAILVFTDGGADDTAYEAVSVRTYGNNYDRKETTTDLGIAELGDYFAGFALQESVHLTTNTTDHPFVDVSTTPAGVWIGMELNHIAAPVVKSGEFSDETGSRLFSWELINPGSATLDEMVAWLDAFATEPAKEADGLGVNTGHLGKDIGTWYTYNAGGQIVTRSGVDPATEGLYLNSIPTADQQRVVQTDDGGTQKAYAFNVSLEFDVGATAKADPNAWYHNWYAAAFNTAGAVVVKNAAVAEIKGLCSAADGSNKIIESFNYDGDADGGTAGTNKNCVCLVEGDGGAVQAKTLYTISRITTVSVTCAPGAETNV